MLFKISEDVYVNSDKILSIKKGEGGKFYVYVETATGNERISVKGCFKEAQKRIEELNRRRKEDQ